MSGNLEARLFRRHLSDQFIQALKANPFWRNICSDRELQPEIRNNVVTVYFCGQALVRELCFHKGTLRASIHHKFVPLQRRSPSIYQSIVWKSPSGFTFEEKLLPQLLEDGRPVVLRAYKRLMKFEAGPEDRLQQEIVTGPKNLIVDQQVEFPIPGSNKIDLCYYDPSLQKIVLAEIKRKDDVRLLVPTDEPEVIGQLRSYMKTIQRQQDHILTELAEVIRLKRELGLGDRLRGVPEGDLRLESKPLLVIGNCTDADVRQIQNAPKNLQDANPWSGLWKHLGKVACGLIACGPKGCRLAIRGGGGQRWWFGD